MAEGQQQGLYDPSFEHDSCGIGFIAQLQGIASHGVVADALTMLRNMEHRGGCGTDHRSGDGAGILTKIPHEFFLEQAHEHGFELPDQGTYGVAMSFLPPSPKAYQESVQALKTSIMEHGFELLGRRPVPTDPSILGEAPARNMPNIEQWFVKHKSGASGVDLERKLYVLRKYTTFLIRSLSDKAQEHFYIPSFSGKTIVYKGQLTTFQLSQYYPDLHNPDYTSALALVHSRFSTNTFPQWKLAQPFRFIAHNGEINTIRGNVNWMRSYEKNLESEVFTKEELDLLKPICDDHHSDSANLDAAVELLTLSGRPLPQVLRMLVPEAWHQDPDMPEDLKNFYRYHASLIEPWDGPAAVCFTNGDVVGATLDRNGLRPARYAVTDDDYVVMSSEVGALPMDPSRVVRQGRLQPGKLFVCDLIEGKIKEDEEVKAEMSSQQPYGKWLEENQVEIEDLPEKNAAEKGYELMPNQVAFGVTDEELKEILIPVAEQGKEPLGAMGSDIPLAVLSKNSQHISHYFRQLFAQVSNPPIDPIRERTVMSLYTSVGISLNLLGESPEHARQIVMEQPVMTRAQMARISGLDHSFFKVKTLSLLMDKTEEEGEMEAFIDSLKEAAEQAVVEGYNVIVLSDRGVNKDKIAVPALLGAGAVHQYLVKTGHRGLCGLIVETGEARAVHHFATLIGYGVNAVHPYLTFDSLEALSAEGRLKVDYATAEANYIQAIGAGLLKIFSKMGISTLQSYHGAQIFEALGIAKSVVAKCFTGTVSRLEGLTFDGICAEVLERHGQAFDQVREHLDFGGLYQWRKEGEKHLFTPETISLMQKACRTGDYELYKQYASLINNAEDAPITLRNLFTFQGREAIPLEEVESVEKILRRFATGAMSFGSLSHEAHSTLAIAMNSIKAKSNSGEGGEDEARYKPGPNGENLRSAIKQVASGRFGVTSYYLSEATEIQIKMAQGAKPGEGGQLPGHKVDEWIGKVRHSTPGVGLISPPPHHDIYSIEDLAQLIHDLKCANRDARINVKLVSEAGVGTVAAGVAKAKADAILISGADGGTGASPISSIYHAGLPWELGLAEAHQTLVMNQLRNRITLQADGQIRTGKDLAFATLLGAEEWGVSTAALIAEGCIMMRKCHLNTCPVGVATQNPKLRKLFTGKAEHVVNLFKFMAMELREIMAELGFRTINDMVGQVQKLAVKEEMSHWKHRTLDLSPILHQNETHEAQYKQVPQEHGLHAHLDFRLVDATWPSIDAGEPSKVRYPIRNTDRSVGAIISHEISKRYRSRGLPEDTVQLKFKGDAGQSFGVFGAAGLTFELEGLANDYLGKGFSGAKMIVYPDRKAAYSPRRNMIVGNVAFYGATSGEAYIRGIAGERFCVRNSGVNVVVEGIGDHGCEYMTGGRVIVLGKTGRNFAAGMSGGIAYIYDPKKKFAKNCNMEMVDLDPLDGEDVVFIMKMIEKHKQFTGSRTATSLINNWQEGLAQFIKVMPKDYKKVLQAQKAASENPTLTEA
ncbi:glutamate synthase large subunit [Persicobacter diffluens]|uniref:Glutamate synthase [NADPH] large chain n=1 Tax=Persicobacter diffluens TaxID=981 RepID=A0AAN4W3B1_9BACT|nr:glutamate synthase [Persicobacter diffluens]